MSRSQREKGKRGEREAVAQCIEYWYADPEKCRRAAQVSGRLTADIVNALPDTHPEVKFYARIASVDFLEQAIRDAQPDQLPVVLMRQTDAGTCKDWIVMFRLKDSEAFVNRYTEQRDSFQTKQQPVPFE